MPHVFSTRTQTRALLLSFVLFLPVRLWFLSCFSTFPLSFSRNGMALRVPLFHETCPDSESVLLFFHPIPAASFSLSLAFSPFAILYFLVAMARSNRDSPRQRSSSSRRQFSGSSLFVHLPFPRLDIDARRFLVAGRVF